MVGAGFILGDSITSHELGQESELLMSLVLSTGWRYLKLANVLVNAPSLKADLASGGLG